MDDAIAIPCPLCCSEVFTSFSSLKYHLLSLAVNLQCTACSKRFDTIVELAEHIGRECRDVDANDNADEAGSEMIQIKIEPTQNDCDDYGNSILAQALLRKDMPESSPPVQEKENCSDETEMELENQEIDKQEEVYYCSSCCVSFSSVNEHLAKYHEGQEVFIQGDEEDPQQPNDKSFFVVQNKDDEEDSDENVDDDVESSSDVMNTLEQEDIIDKDGRMYTRKVVQIEKFWSEDDTNVKKPPPVTQKYYLDNNKAVKIDEENIPEDKSVLEVHQCSACNLNFCKLEQYYSHKCNAKKIEHDYGCNICGGTFTNHRALSSHIKTHKSGSDPVSGACLHICEVCKTEFPTFKSLRLHRRMHEPVKTKQIDPPVSYGLTQGEYGDQPDVRVMFLCTICNKSYDQQYEEVHMKSHSTEKSYDCEICNRKFFTKVNLEMHLRVHTNGKKFTCSYCKKGFLSYENLQNHVKHLCQSRPYECQYCGRRFMRPHEKVKHERIHTGEKPHVCEICGKAFRVSYCLTLHMRTHSGTRPYQCTHCGKRFKAHSVYNHHLLTHSTERNYKCPYCPKAFKTGVQLAGHKNSHIKPFTCTECNRPFASLYAVRAHMETHKRENNLKHSCGLCGASYARMFALKDHMKEQHSETIKNEVGIGIDQSELIDGENEYAMVAEGLNATNMILKDNEGNLVVLDQSMGNIEMVEEVTT